MFRTNQQATELSHPRVGAFDDSAPFVATQFLPNYFCIQSAQQRLPALSQRGSGKRKMRFWANCRLLGNHRSLFPG